MSLPIVSSKDAPDTQRITRSVRRKRNEYTLIAWSVTLHPYLQYANTLSIVCCASLERSSVTASGPVRDVLSVAWSVPTRVVPTYPV
jgi:hypothetical protein